MEFLSENTYWIAVAHLPRWQTERINQFIIQIIHEQKLTWEYFFSLNIDQWKERFAFTDKELIDLEATKNDLPRLAFIAEQLQSEGIEVIPLNSPFYPAVLKDNLKTKNSPPVLYLKGKRDLLQQEIVAIVGSRNAGKAAIEFTDIIAKKIVAENKVIVSGFAKGVDKQALDSTLSANGKSIIVLPQGILTFQSGFNRYYTHIAKGDVLVVSTFFPKAGWEVGLAMARNIYIYGLANETYVAESENKGGTWEGAMNGLRRNRKVYVRIPEENERNANTKLVQLGAIPVDQSGNCIKQAIGDNPQQNNIEDRIMSLLKQDIYSSREIKMILKLDWDSQKLSAFLKNNPNVRTIDAKPKKYTLNDVYLPSLFD